MNDISLTENGITYEASYEIFGDTLVVYLPDGSQKPTELRGLLPDSAAITHLRAYVKAINKESPK